MTTTRQFPARFLVAVTAVTGLALVAVGCGSSSPKATPASSPTTTATTATATDPVDSPYCQTVRKWTVHEFNGEGDAFADDPVAFKRYWTDYAEFVDTATQQSPAEIRDDWTTGYDLVRKFTPVLEKYDYDLARAQAKGTPAELALGAQLDQGPNP